MMEVRTQLHVEKDNRMEALSFLNLYFVWCLFTWKTNAIEVKLKSVPCKHVNPTDIMPGPMSNVHNYNLHASVKEVCLWEIEIGKVLLWM